MAPYKEHSLIIYPKHFDIFTRIAPDDGIPAASRK